MWNLPLLSRTRWQFCGLGHMGLLMVVTVGAPEVGADVVGRWSFVRNETREESLSIWEFLDEFFSGTATERRHRTRMITSARRLEVRCGSWVWRGMFALFFSALNEGWDEMRLLERDVFWFQKWVMHKSGFWMLRDAYVHIFYISCESHQHGRKYSPGYQSLYDVAMSTMLKPFHVFVSTFFSLFVWQIWILFYIYLNFERFRLRHSKVRCVSRSWYVRFNRLEFRRRASPWLDLVDDSLLRYVL